MNNTVKVILLGLSVIVSILVACAGYEILKSTILGWLLLALGTAYPCALILLLHTRRRRKIWRLNK